MMRTLLTNVVVCACLSAFSLAQPVAAQSDKSEAAQHSSPAAKKMKRKVYKGTIEVIDVTAGTLTVKKATTSKTFKVADDAKFVTSDNRNTSLAPLRPGDLVNVRFTEDGDVAIAHHIAQAAKKDKAAPKRE